MASKQPGLIQALKESLFSLADGLPSVKDFVPQVGAELDRAVKQGANELASALFNGNGFVQYGAGQYTVEPENTQEATHVAEHDRDGMER